jgi:hypothetical protein
MVYKIIMAPSTILNMYKLYIYIFDFKEIERKYKIERK